MGTPFSRRHGYRPKVEITVREDSPKSLRIGLLQILHDEIGLSYDQVRHIVCYILRTAPDPNNWSEVPNIRDEVTHLVQSCPWYRIYDVIESFYRYLRDPESMFPVLVGRARFMAPVTIGAEDILAARINELFEEEGIGWQLINGQIVIRGSDQFEHAVTTAMDRAEEAGYQAVQTELEEARRDLSRRPRPDVTGAIQHCIAALECAARTLARNDKATLGDLVKKQATNLGIPRPLDQAIEKLWGYSSEMGRHLREGWPPSREEAELLLGIASAVITYLLEKAAARNPRD